MPSLPLPNRPSLEHLRKQAKTRRRQRGIPLSQAQQDSRACLVTWSAGVA